MSAAYKGVSLSVFFSLLAWFLNSKNHYFNAGLANTHFMHKIAQGNRSNTQRMYRDRFSYRIQSDRRRFELVCQQLSTSGLLYASRSDIEFVRYHSEKKNAKHSRI